VLPHDTPSCFLQLTSLPGGVVVYGNERKLGPDAVLQRLVHRIDQDADMVREANVYRLCL